MSTVPDDHVVLVDDHRNVQGLAPRATVHTTDTPLHLAFSCYVFRPNGELLLTRRALSKVAWPGVWTNSFCGHPRLDEPFEQTIERYAAHELGMTVYSLDSALPSFRYRAVDASGIVENEICPVYVATAQGEPSPNPDEVMDHRWVPADEVESLVRAAPWAVSPWMAEQLPGVLAHRRQAAGAPAAGTAAETVGEKA